MRPFVRMAIFARLRSLGTMCLRALWLPLCCALGCEPVGTVGPLNSPPASPKRAPAPPIDCGPGKTEVAGLCVPSHEPAPGPPPAPEPKPLGFEKEAQYQDVLSFTLKNLAGMPRISRHAEFVCSRGYVAGKVDYLGFNIIARARNQELGCVEAVGLINKFDSSANIGTRGCPVKVPDDVDGADMKGKSFLSGRVQNEKLSRDAGLSREVSGLMSSTYDLCYEAAWNWGVHQPTYANNTAGADIFDSCIETLTNAVEKGYVKEIAKIHLGEKCEARARELDMPVRTRLADYIKARMRKD